MASRGRLILQALENLFAVRDGEGARLHLPQGNLEARDFCLEAYGGFHAPRIAKDGLERNSTKVPILLDKQTDLRYDCAWSE